MYIYYFTKIVILLSFATPVLALAGRETNCFKHSVNQANLQQLPLKKFADSISTRAESYFQFNERKSERFVIAAVFYDKKQEHHILFLSDTFFGEHAQFAHLTTQKNKESAFELEPIFAGELKIEKKDGQCCQGVITGINANAPYFLRNNLKNDPDDFLNRLKKRRPDLIQLDLQPSTPDKTKPHLNIEQNSFAEAFRDKHDFNNELTIIANLGSSSGTNVKLNSIGETYIRTGKLKLFIDRMKKINFSKIGDINPAVIQLFIESLQNINDNPSVFTKEQYNHITRGMYSLSQGAHSLEAIVF